MIRLIRRWRALPPRERRLLPEAAACLLWARVILALFPLETALRIMKRETRPGAGCLALSSNPQQIKLAVERAARHVPFKAVCLQQAFAAFVMLRRHGLPATVHLGVRRQEGGLRAHAWSVSGNTSMTGTELASAFVPIAVFTA